MTPTLEGEQGGEGTGSTLSDWGGVEAEANRIMAESPEPFTPQTIANVREFIELVRGRCPLPEVF